ncbi:hypothetical protein EDD80_10689 [Anseongella ginsenosidimutans]|uniref:Uncharacterized protein n=1 Tax=Anseongella ginsenosidimutans TaxID=496056 RepID=A0A4R3KRL9_9SPHI|nr:hypothetical protein EDD80_10689 [Anseongella ginsenosidimutans]
MVGGGIGLLHGADFGCPVSLRLIFRIPAATRPP